MAIEIIDLGTVAQDGADGDVAREAFEKVNANFAEHESEIDALTPRVTTLENEVGQLEIQTGQIQGNLNNLTESFNTLSPIVGENTADIQNLENSIENIQTSKVDKQPGMQLSEENYTTADKNKLTTLPSAPFPDGKTYNLKDRLWVEQQTQPIKIYSSVPSDPPLYTFFMVVDTEKPVVTAFSLSSNQASPLQILQFEAADDTAVTGYWLGETAGVPSLTDPRWSTIKPVQYSTTSLGQVTVYARVRDSAGNISDASSTQVTIISSSYIDVSWPYNSVIHTAKHPVAAGSFNTAITFTYTPTQNIQIKNIQTPMYKDPDAAYPGVGGVTLNLKSDSISGTQVGTANIPNISSSSVSTKIFTFASPVSLVANTTYFFTFYITPGSNSGGDVVQRLVSDPTASGTIYNSYNGAPPTTTQGVVPLRMEKV